MSAHEKMNILMVDDQPAKLLSYEVILGELGENLIKANSGTEALDYLLKNDVAVVLMDVSMPELDGFELAGMIRQHPRFQQTAIIFISAVHLTDLDRVQVLSKADADKMKLEGAALKENPLLIQKIIAEKLSDKVQIMMVPSDGKFFFANDVLRGAMPAATVATDPQDVVRNQSGSR